MKRIIYPCTIIGEYTDGWSATVSGNDEDDCMYKLAKLQDKHGDLIYYSEVVDSTTH